MPHRTLRAGSHAALALITMAAGPAAAAHRQVTLETPDAVIAQPFSLVRGAIEAGDGSLLVSDWIEERIGRVDFEAGTVVDQGRVGAGPAEFRLPGAFYPFHGDSVLLVDIGNRRLAVLTPDGVIRRTFTPRDPSAASPVGADTSGRLYYVVPPWRASAPLAGDSVELRVLEPATGESRVVARVHGSTPVSGSSMEPRVPFVVFAPQDGFAVAATGRIAIVRDGDYSVHWSGAGEPADGPPNAVESVPVSTEERETFVRGFVQAAPMSGRAQDGGLGHTPAPMASDPAVRRMVRASSFATTLPPFRSGDVYIDGRGRLWVGRYDRDAEPRRFDVFDTVGRRTAVVRLRPGRRLVALGAGHAYVVRIDDSGLQWLERYTLPGPATSR